MMVSRLKKTVLIPGGNLEVFKGTVQPKIPRLVCYHLWQVSPPKHTPSPKSEPAEADCEDSKKQSFQVHSDEAVEDEEQGRISEEAEPWPQRILIQSRMSSQRNLALPEELTRQKILQPRLKVSTSPIPLHWWFLWTSDCCMLPILPFSEWDLYSY